MGATHVGIAGGDRPMGHEQVTVTATAVHPSGIDVLDSKRLKKVVIQAVDQPINWRDDGTTPTGSVGQRVATGDTFVYDGDISGILSLKLIRASDATGDADTRLAYYGI